MTALFAGLCGSLLVGGLIALIHGFRRVPVTRSRRASESPAAAWARLTRRPPGKRGRRRDLFLAIGLVVGVVAYLVTGWAVLVVVVPIGVGLVPYLLGDPPNNEIEMLSALDRWIRGMAATIQTGHSITDALRASARNAPPVLEESVRRLAARIGHRWSVPEAVAAMADELDTPDADAVLAALGLAAGRGGTGATATLNALTDSITDRLRALRDIEAERAKPRVVVRQVTIISLVVLGLAFLGGREFFAPYATPIGQVILVALIAAYFASLFAMRRLTAPPRRQRILQGAAR